MQYSVVLNIRALADRDHVIVTTRYGIKPDTGMTV
jgi:hypothetical protein